jgi:hypothetical protein
MREESLTNKIRSLKEKDAVAKSSKKQLEDYIEASKLFDELVEKGYTQKRGYNLMTIDKTPFRIEVVNSNIASLF